MPHLIPDRKALHGEPLPGRIAAGRNNPMPHFSSQDFMPITAQLTPRGRDVTYPFLSDLAAIRQRTRQHIRHCAETPETNAATEAALRLLHDALAITHRFNAGGAVFARTGTDGRRWPERSNMVLRDPPRPGGSLKNMPPNQILNCSADLRACERVAFIVYAASRSPAGRISQMG
jgi:hypothetical protein